MKDGTWEAAASTFRHLFFRVKLTFYAQLNGAMTVVLKPSHDLIKTEDDCLKNLIIVLQV